MSTVNATRQEMRKQAANIVGKIVVTGHESVQGSRRPMREDIYKKHISADKVPERLPYAIHRHTHAGAWSSCWQCLLSVSTYSCTYTVTTRSYGRATIPKHSCQLPNKPYLSHPRGRCDGGACVCLFIVQTGSAQLPTSKHNPSQSELVVRSTRGSGTSDHEADTVHCLAL